MQIYVLTSHWLCFSIKFIPLFTILVELMLGIHWRKVACFGVFNPKTEGMYSSELF